MPTNNNNPMTPITDAMDALGNHAPALPTPSPTGTGTDIQMTEELRIALTNSHNAMNQFIADACQNIRLPQGTQQHPKNIRELITLMETLLEKQHDSAKLATLEELRNLIESISDYLGIDAISSEVNEKPILLIKKDGIPSFNNSTQFDLSTITQLIQHDRVHNASYFQNTFTHPYTREVVSIGVTHEIRPLWNDDNKKLSDGIEKTTYERTQEVKIFIKKAVDAIHAICGRTESTPAHMLTVAATSPLTTVSPINYSNFRTQLLNDFCSSTIVHATYLIPELETNRQCLRELVDFVRECPYATINADHNRYQQLQKKLESTILSIEKLLEARETLKLVNNAKLLTAQDSKKAQYAQMTNTNLHRELEGVLKDLKNAQALLFPTATIVPLASSEVTPHYSKKAEFKITVAGKEYSSLVELNKDENAPVTACIQVSENKSDENDKKLYPVLVLKQKAAKEAAKASSDDKAKQSTDAKGVNVVLLIDHSGSMYDHNSFVPGSIRAAAVQKFATGLVEALHEKNQSLSVSEIAFGSTAQVQYTKKSYAELENNKIHPGGSMSSSLGLTYPDKMFSYSNSHPSPIETVADAITLRSDKSEKRTVHIFIVTDGDFDTPSDSLDNNHLTDASYRYTHNNYGVILKAAADMLRREGYDIETHYVMISGDAQKKVDGIYATTKHSIQVEEDIKSTIGTLTTEVESHTQSIPVTVAVTACGHAIVPLNTMTSGSLSLDPSIQTHDSTYHVNEKGHGVVLPPELRNLIDNRNDDSNTATSAHDQKIADLAVAETFKDFYYFHRIEFQPDGALENNMREGQSSHASQSSHRANAAAFQPSSRPKYGSAAPLFSGNALWMTAAFHPPLDPLVVRSSSRSGAAHFHHPSTNATAKLGNSAPPTPTTTYGNPSSIMFFNANPSASDGGQSPFQQPQQPQQPIPCNNIYEAIENGLQLIRSNPMIYAQLTNFFINPSFDPIEKWNSVKNSPQHEHDHPRWLEWFLACINGMLIRHGYSSYQVAPQPAPQSMMRPGW